MEQEGEEVLWGRGGEGEEEWKGEERERRGELYHSHCPSAWTGPAGLTLGTAGSRQAEFEVSLLVWEEQGKDHGKACVKRQQGFRSCELELEKVFLAVLWGQHSPGSILCPVPEASF